MGHRSGRNPAFSFLRDTAESGRREVETIEHVKEIIDTNATCQYFLTHDGPDSIGSTHWVATPADSCHRLTAWCLT
jgi:hypothetical protein